MIYNESISLTHFVFYEAYLAFSLVIWLAIVPKYAFVVYFSTKSLLILLSGQELRTRTIYKLYIDGKYYYSRLYYFIADFHPFKIETNLNKAETTLFHLGHE